MLTVLKILTGYVPDLVTRRLAADATPLAQPLAEPFTGVALFADISGFTRLTERLSQAGPQGVEELTHLLNRYFGALIDLISAHGGDVVKFAGDAVLAVWPSISVGAALSAAQCGLAMQKAVQAFEAEGAPLSLRLSIGAGELVIEHLGGEFGLWQILAVGDLINQVNQAEQQAQPGEVVLSPSVWALTHQACVGETTPAGQVRLKSVHAPVSLAPLRLCEPTLAMEIALKAYIPGAILARVTAGQTAWLAELRRVTVLFVHLPKLDHTMPLAIVHDAIRALQKALYHYEGSVDKISEDDKGVALVAALGLPPLAHEDDATRGVQAALAMHAELQRLGWRSAIGVATGRAFCGSIGNERRREYTMIGDVVNLAARLMQAAIPVGAVLCDAVTYQAAGEDVTFETLPPLLLKGKAEPVVVYGPRAVLKNELVGSRKMRGAQTPIVGRKTERRLLSEQLQILLRGGAGGEIIIEGEAGIGKSRLVDDLLQLARVSGVENLVGAADAVERLTPYYAWRPIFSQLLKIDAENDSDAQRQHALEQIGLKPIWLWARLLPLLNAVLPLELPDNEVTAQMTGQVRADNVRDLLLQIVQSAAAQAPKLIAIEDTHWLDSASWALTHLVSQRVKQVLLVLATRPLSEAVPLEYNQLLNAPTTKRLQLEMLSTDEALTLVCQRLGVTSLPEPAEVLIREKAEGNPFFSEELAYALRDSGLLQIEGHECWLSVNAGDLSAIKFPDTVQGVITSRIDRLPPPEQLTLKVASVIGRVFPFRTLHDIYPVESDKTRLPDYIKDLAKLDLTPLDVPEPNLTYIFKHIITQEVAYNLMLYEHRRALHRAIAEWHEHTYQSDLSLHYQLLAYHWRSADEPTQAINYLEKAGEQAFFNYANEEAIAFFSQALALDTQSPQPSSPTRRGRWRLRLGEAYANASKFDEGQEQLEAGLALLGEPPPLSVAQQGFSLFKQLARQARHRLWPKRYIGRLASRAENLREIARAYERLTEVYFFKNAVFSGLCAAFTSLNSAELAGPSPELARAYAPIGAIFGMAPWHGVAEAYCQHALQLAQSLNNLPARIWVDISAGVYYSGVGRWDEARQLFDEVLSLSERLGDRRRWDDGATNLVMLNYCLGEWQHGFKLAQAFYQSASRRGDLANQTWALFEQAYLLLAREAPTHPEVQATVQRLREVTEAQKNLDETTRINVYGLFAWHATLLGQAEPALAMFEKAYAVVIKSQPTFYHAVLGYMATFETALYWHAQEPCRVELKNKLPALLKALKSFANVFPVGRAYLHYYQGWVNVRAGRRPAALASWRAALASAQKLTMPYLQGLAYAALGQHLPSEAADRVAHQRQAQTIFEALGAARGRQV